jgi:hypothetical protein
MPVSLDALSIRVSSMFNVVLIYGHLRIICINMHLSYVFCQYSFEIIPGITGSKIYRGLAATSGYDNFPF